jgi:hypothetical protein
MDQYSYGEPKWTSSAEQEAIRKNMGYTLTHANRMNLATLTPRSDLASSKYCLANPGTEYLVYQPRAGEAFSVDLKAGTYRYQWFNPASGTPRGLRRAEAVRRRDPSNPPRPERTTTARTALAAQAGRGSC